MVAEPTTATSPDRDIERIQEVADSVSEKLAGRPVGHVAAVLATDPRFQPLLEVPAFIEWVATEISGGRRPAIHPSRAAAAPQPVLDDGAPLRTLQAVAVEPSGDETTWTWRIDHVLATGSLVAFLQPIVDLRTRSVVGYEALARFTDSPGHPALQWFAEAAARGREEELEALAIRAALARLPTCPRGCFLSINVSPRALDSEPVRRALTEPGNLHGVVIELTAGSYPSDVDGLARSVEALKAGGAKLAVSYVAGHTTEEELAALRPSVVKLAEPFIAQRRRDSGDDDTGATLARIAGPFGTRLLAQNVERTQDLKGLERVGVKMVQGFVVGVPTTTWHPLAGMIDVTTPVGATPAHRTTAPCPVEPASDGLHS